ncbi:MAG: FAD-dependent oxidoreductase [Actinomycetales bacterium]|nr:FAD-dependent oxidoreductase [Actinomycetales bacterium]
MTPGEVVADVVVVGAGPAGLTAARELARDRRVLVLDRESEAGGIPRHSDHLGYGVRDLRRVTSGPAYARRLVANALDAGAEVRTEATVTGWAGERVLEVTSPQGRLVVRGGAVLLATGARERPRPARLVPGDRPAGVLTTGLLQNLVHLQHRSPGRRAVVVGAELVSWSAVLTLREAGTETVLLATEHERGESYAAVRATARLALRVPVATCTRVVRVIGHDAVEGVELLDLRTGRRRVVACDTVVFTGDWIPDHELARLGGLDLDPATRGPRVDSALRTSAAGVLAAGNLVHPVDTADAAALDGRHVADQVRRWLDLGEPPPRGARIVAVEPFRWVAPSLLVPGAPAPARRRLLLWAEDSRLVPRVVARQDGREVGRRSLPWPVAPGRVFRVPWSLLERADPLGGDVTIGLL